MAVSEQLKTLVAQMPNADGRGMYCTDIDKDKTEKAIAQIHEGGRDNVLGLIDMLGKPGSDQDVKPHYALQCLANYVLQSRDEQARRDFAEVLAAQLGSDRSKYVRGYLYQELQWAGRREACPALGKLLCDEDLSEPASMALVAIRDGAADQFRAALAGAKGTCKLNIVQGLGAVGDKQSLATLAALLTDDDREVRLAAGWGVARTGDSGAIGVLIKAAGVPDGWERIQATKHCLVLAEKLTAAGDKTGAARIYAYLRDSRKDAHEKYVRDLAEKALAAT
ncbi:MAG: HEAT repeat domain-containing protein [Thermoguttaceae bacterium]|jgi:HEAT repeat protein